MRPVGKGRIAFKFNSKFEACTSVPPAPSPRPNHPSTNNSTVARSLARCLILELSHGATAPPVGTVGTVDNLQLRGNDAVKESVLQKNEALDVSDVTRENSKAGDSVRAPKVLESRSLSDSSDTAQIEEAAAAPEEKPAPEEQPAPIKKKNIWHQLSGIVTGNKG
eukprot:2568715-Rhodomonas_salina.1